MTKQAITEEVRPVRIDWANSLKKLAVGDRLLVHNCPQQRAGSAISDYNKDGKRFVSKKAKDGGVYVIRVT